MSSTRITWIGLAALCAGSGVLHFTQSKFYEPMIPKQLGDAKTWVAGSGALELVIATGLVVPQTRRVTARAAEALFVGVFPGNVKMTVDALTSPKAAWWWKAGTVGRLPLQIPLVLWARKVGSDAAAR